MKTFYQSQRRRLGILLDDDGQPVGGKWSFDTENRKKLPKDIDPPPLPLFKPNNILKEVVSLVEKRFSDHPGDAKQFWLPSSRQEALSWLEDFIKNPEFLSNPSSDSFSDSLSFPSDTSEDGFQFRKKRWRRLPSQPPDKDLKRQINLAKEDTKEYK